MFFIRIFQYAGKKIIRNINTISSDIYSSILHVKATTSTKQCLKSALENKELKIRKWNNVEIEGVNHFEIFPEDLNTYETLCCEGTTYKATLVKKSSIVALNCLSIEHKQDLTDILKNVHQKYPNLIIQNVNEKEYKVYCRNIQDFNSAFFMNGFQDLNVHRLVFPYIKQMNLKITPNILSANLPKNIDSAIKASNIFPNIIFNHVSKLGSSNTWLFYLGNEADYLKMLETPFYCLDQILHVTPYYGTPLIYTPGESNPGKLIHIYYDGKCPILEKLIQFKDCYKSNFLDFENKKILSFSFANIEDFNKLKFTNGRDLFGGKKYTMVIGDEISSENIYSPYLETNLPLESECKPILDKIRDNISNYEIIKYGRNVVLRVIPKSMKDYRKIETIQFKYGERLNQFFPHLLAPSNSFLLDSIFFPSGLYNERKVELENNKGIQIEKVNEKNFVIVNLKEKSEKILFYLANLSPNIWLIYRNSANIIQLKPKLVMTSMKAILVPTSKLTSILTEIKTPVSITDAPIIKEHSIIHFSNSNDAHTYLFRDYRKFPEPISSGLKLSSLSYGKSRLVIKDTIKLSFSTSIMHHLSITQICLKNGFTHYEVDIESLNDFANVVSFSDLYDNTKDVKFIPGPEIHSL